MTNLVINKQGKKERCLEMTQKEKINSYKKQIVYLYTTEGRSKSYIARLFELDRKTMINIINNEWKLEKAQKKYLQPSNQKFLNKHKKLIMSRLHNNMSISDIAQELGVSRQYLRRTIVYNDTELHNALEEYNKKYKSQRTLPKESKQEEYDFYEIDGEEWKEILGYDTYYISNQGRLKKYVKSYDTYRLLKPIINSKNGYLEYSLVNGKCIKIHRLVAFAFLGDNWTKEKNTVNHIDGNKSNNCVENLEWVSQSKNNKKAYENGRKASIAYSSLGRFKDIVLYKDNKEYHFKTIESLAKFLNKSPTQIRRYITKECKFKYKIKLVY